MARAGLQCALADLLALFIPYFITDLDQSHLVSRMMVFAVFGVVSVSIELLPMITNGFCIISISHNQSSLTLNVKVWESNCQPVRKIANLLH